MFAIIPGVDNSPEDATRRDPTVVCDCLPKKATSFDAWVSAELALRVHWKREERREGYSTILDLGKSSLRGGYEVERQTERERETTRLFASNRPPIPQSHLNWSGCSNALSLHIRSFARERGTLRSNKNEKKPLKARSSAWYPDNRPRLTSHGSPPWLTGIYHGILRVQSVNRRLPGPKSLNVF